VVEEGSEIYARGLYLDVHNGGIGSLKDNWINFKSTWARSLGWPWIECKGYYTLPSSKKTPFR
jgi:hypothetical protein